MADSSVLLEVIVEGKNIKLVQRDIEELGSSINKSSMATEKDTKQKKKNKKATDDLGAGVRNYNKGQKGVAQATANGTKAFSKQREAIGGGSSGLVGAYATIAANLFAATAAFGALRRAAQVETLIEGVTALGAASGQNIPLLAESLKEATGAAISLDQALRTASFASSSGFDASQIEQLAEVGRKAAVALGRDVGDAVDRLTRGVAKLEPEILDELGIIVRLDDATAAYAAQIGKTVNQLTAFERQQAFANATIEQGLSKFGDIDVDPNPYDKLAASLQDIANTGLALVNTFLGPLVSIFAENKLALASFVLVLTKGIAGQAAASFGTLSKSASDAAQRTAKEAKKAAKAQKTAFKDSRNALKMIPEELSKVAKEYAELPKQAKSYDDLIEQEKALAKTIEKRTRALNNANRTPEGIAKSKKEIAELTDLQGRLNAEIGKSKAPRLDPAIADTLANIKGQEANIFQSLDDDPSFGNFKDKFKEAKVLGNEYADTLRKSGKANFDFLKGIPFIGKGLGGVSKGLTAATLGFARFGIAGKVAIRGIVFAVPILGQILLGISLAFEALKKAAGVISDLLPKASKLEQTQRAVQASTQTLKDTTKAYEESLVSNTIATVEYLSVLSESASEEEKLEMAQKLRTEAIRAQITFIEGQGTAFSDLVTRLKEYDKAQKLATANAGIFGKAILSVQEFGANLAFRFTQAFTLIGLSFRELFQSFENTIADFAVNGEGELSFLAKIFGITEAEIAGTRVQADLLEKQLARTFKPVEDAVFAGAGTEAQRSFVEAFQASEASARELTDTVLGVGKDIDTAAISNAFKTAFADVDAEGLSEAVRKAAQAADVDGSGALETDAEKRALIISLIEQGTEKARNLADESKNISSSIDGAKENLSNFITGLSATKSSVSSIIGEVGILTSNLTESGLSGEILQEKIKELPTAFKELLGLQEMSGKEAVAAVKNFNILINRINLLEQAEKRRLTTVRATNAGLKTAGKLNLQAYEAIIANETKVNQLQKDRIDAQIQLAELEVQRQEKAADGNITPELIAAQQKLFDLETQRESLSVGILNAEQQKLEVDLRRLDAEKEAVALGQEIAKNSAKELENRQKLENALSGRGATLTEGQQITAQIEAARVAVTAAETEKALAESRLAIEKQVLEAKLNALNAQITTANQGLPEGEQQAQIDVSGILQGFDENTDMTLAKFQAKIDGAKANLQGTLIDAAFGGREEANNPVASFVDNFEASLTRAGVALAAIGGDGASPFDQMKVQIQAARDVAKPFFDQLRSMGPDGELALAVSEGAFTIADSLTAITDSSATAADKLQAVGAAVGAIGSILQASANDRVNSIDKEIAAEKKRDGKSKESLARIQQMEKKKDAIKKKAFEQNKKIQIAQAVIGAAAAFAQAPVIAAQAASVAGPAAPAVFAATLAQTKAMILATTALQIAAIASTSYSGGGSVNSGGTGGGSTPTVSVGERKSTVDLAKSQSSSGELSYLRGAQGTGGPENFRPAFMGAQYRAMGGATTGYVVGEQGPELFVPSTPGTIVPNSEVRGGAPVNATFNINTIDASGVEEVLTGQRGNIIGMLRESANSYGNGFFEEVETELYGDTSGGMNRA